ncbi:MAG: hypothetical protein ABL886_08260 [Rhodoglobus sp.]
MDVDAVRDGLIAFAEAHQEALLSFPRRESQLLELAAMTLAAMHYERAGYQVGPSNTGDHTEFRMKLSTRGRPENFSWWTATRGADSFEIHANLPVVSAYGRDNGTYVVDVAVVRAGSLSRLISMGPGRRALPNAALLTFAEVKRLVVYPMLLAQFIGIVHEILPRFLGKRRPRGFRSAGHFDPALMSIGYLHSTSRGIVGAYFDRGYRVSVVTNCDGHISRLRDSNIPSPLQLRMARTVPQF